MYLTLLKSKENPEKKMEYKRNELNWREKG